MNPETFAAALLALAVVATGAAAAAPGNAPVDAPTDDHAEQSDDRGADPNETAADERADAAGQAARDEGQRGPRADLPEPVPDFVSEIHDLIRQHVSGSLDGVLGDQVSDRTPETRAEGGSAEMADRAASARTPGAR
jgi:hypothetical protein